MLYYMPPQLWAWAPWRIRKVRRFVDRVLSGLNFEADWYRERDPGRLCRASILRRSLPASAGRDASSIPQKQRPDGRYSSPVGEELEVERNWPVMLEVIRILHEQHPDVRFRVPLYRESYRELCEESMDSDDVHLPIDFVLGKTSEIIKAADCCLMVFGSVSLEMLARQTPAAVVYRPPWTMVILFWPLITCKFMSLPNLMTGRELLPEFFVLRNPDAHARRIAEDTASLARFTR